MALLALFYNSKTYINTLMTWSFFWKSSTGGYFQCAMFKSLLFQEGCVLSLLMEE